MYGKIQKLRFVAMGTSMMLAAMVFILGAVWIKYLYNGIDKAHLEDAGREIRSRITVQRQVVLADMAQFQLPQYSNVLMQAGALKEKSAEGIIPENFEFAAYYDNSRKFVAAAKRDGKARTQTPLPAEVMKTVVSEGASLFDIAASEGQSSGILLLEGKPWLMD